MRRRGHGACNLVSLSGTRSPLPGPAAAARSMACCASSIAAGPAAMNASNWDGRRSDTRLRSTTASLCRAPTRCWSPKTTIFMGSRLARGLPLVGVRLHDAWLAIGIGELFDFGCVFDGVALGIFVIGKEIVAEQVAARAPGARNPAFAGVKHGLDPRLPVAHLERRVMEGGDAVASLAEGQRMMVSVARPEAQTADEAVGKFEAERFAIKRLTRGLIAN